ncbi:NADP-dependent oxidoreductase domain-containing protein [Lipomyces kononenkoae]|uniref:NADP-dependent oxidoreductase domain-containing protein n=1 Tax=Lipomyces kononenkoae TaxID=34357 RepID=A0ACC3SQU0_LIPKO
MSISNKTTITLSSGYEIPVIGLGTWQSKPNEVAQAVEVALKYGYRHIDGAAIYRNEEEVGRGWQASGVSRGQIFLTSKLWNSRHAPQEVLKAIDQTLSELGTDYLDLFLIHWPLAFRPGSDYFPRDEEGLIVLDRETKIEDTWRAMEKLVEQGKVRSIGVSNFDIPKLEKLLSFANIKPSVNQIEGHAYLLQPELHEFHKKHGIVPIAYSPLGNNIYGKARVIDDPEVKEIAESLQKNPANVLVSYLIQKGFVVIPKSVTPSRIKSNFDVFSLPTEVVARLEKLDRGIRYNDPVAWGFDMFGEQGGDAAALEKAKQIVAQNK